MNKTLRYKNRVQACNSLISLSWRANSAFMREEVRRKHELHMREGEKAAATSKEENLSNVNGVGGRYSG